MDAADPEATPKSGNRALFACGGCCLLILVVGAVAGYLIEQRVRGAVLDLAATTMTAVSEELFKDLAMPDGEVDAAMAPIEAFADQIRAGEVSLEQGVAVGKALAEGHVPALVMSRGFEAKHLLPSGLSEEEKAAGHVTTTRFAEGIAKESIPEAERDEVMSLLTEQVTQTGANGQQRTTTRFKQKLTDEELRAVLAEMKQAADDAGVADQEFQLDLAAEIGEAIERGMAE